MLKAIGVLETNSIAQGILSADVMLKTAMVELLESRSICPGKYLTILYGEVSAVQNSIEAGCAHAGAYLVDSSIIPNVHPLVADAVRGLPMSISSNAIGSLEFFSVTAAIYAADAAVKAADVILVELRLGIAIGGKSYFVINGDVAAVKEAVKAACEVGQEHGLLLNSIVIPSPHEQLLPRLM